MSGKIINDLNREKEASERGYQYWESQAALLKAKADAEECEIAAMALRAEVARCEYFAEVEKLKAGIRNARKALGL